MGEDGVGVIEAGRACSQIFDYSQIFGYNGKYKFYNITYSTAL